MADTDRYSSLFGEVSVPKGYYGIIDFDVLNTYEEVPGVNGSDF